MLIPTSFRTAVALALATTSASVAVAQDNGASIEKLVQKGVLSSQEGEEVRAEMTRDFSSTSAGKIKLSNSVTELKIYGDLRLRYQYDNSDAQVDPIGAARTRTVARVALNAVAGGFAYV